MQKKALCAKRPVLLNERRWLMQSKTLLVMKLMCILLTVCCLGASAHSVSQTVTFSGKKVSLEIVFGEIKKQTGYLVTCDMLLLKSAKAVSIEAKDMQLEEFLALLLKNQPMEFTIRNKTIFITAKRQSTVTFNSDETEVLEQTISGTVKDTDGKPLQNVSVILQPINKGTVTNESGNFSFKNIAIGFYTLELSLVSYSKLSKEIYLGNSAFHINITLEPSSDMQQEVVVSTGYQTISRERSAGSFSKPDMQILAERPGSVNILQRLDGLVAGLTVNNSPSASQNPFLIRGLSTVGIPAPGNANTMTGTNRNPLYVVDGVPLDDISTINPQDVADITVLKDATAASIWGARASNGVIVVTTKKGTVNEKITLQYDGFVNFQGRPQLDNMPVLDNRQFITAATEIFNLQDADNPIRYPQLYPWNTISGYQGIANTGVPPHEAILYAGYLGNSTPQQTQSSLDSLASINNRQQIKDLWYRNALLTSHTLSASGGGKIHSFYGSVTYTNTTTNRPEDRDNFFKLNFRQDFRFNERLQVYVITDLSNSIINTHRNIAADNRFYPYQLFKDDNGNNLSIPYMRYLSDSLRLAFQQRSRINLDYIPLNEVGLGSTKNDALLNRIISGVSLKIIKGLKFEGTYGYIKGNRKTTAFDDEQSYLVRAELLQFTVAPTPSSTPQYYLPNKGGQFTTAQQTQRNWTIRNQLVYDKQWRDNYHQLTLLAGQESQEQLMTYNSNTLRGFDPRLQTFGIVDHKTLNSPGLAGPVMPNSGSRSTLINNASINNETQIRFRSYYANGAYTFNDKYSVNASWRIDGSNLFGLDKSAQNKPVWSIGTKWAIGREKFISSANWMDDLAIRATYGITGNAPIPGTASSYDVLNPVTGGALPGGSGLIIATAANPKLTWESTKTINAGLDFTVLNNRITGSIDIYKKKTDNLLGELPVNSFTGYSTIVGNLGTLENKGVEITLTTLNVKTKNFNWTTQLAMAYNRNRIIRLNTLAQITTGHQQTQQRYVEGYSAFALFAYEYAGLNDKGDPTILLQDKSATSATNVSTPDDVKFMGTYQPKWSGGVTNRFNYRNFRLTINTVFNLGHVMRRDVNLFYTGRLRHGNMSAGGFTSGNVHAEFANRWKKAGDEELTNIPSYVVSQATSDSRRDVRYYQYADINVIDASYVKLRDITLSYTLPNHISNILRSNYIDLRVQVGNLMLWKANKFDIDPEFHDAFSGVRGILSNQHTFTFGMHVNF